MPVETTAMLEKPSADAAPRCMITGRGLWVRLVNELLALAGPHAQLQSHSERPWSSATFTGTRHTIALVFRGADAQARVEAYREALPEHEFTISRHLVADAAVNLIERDAIMDTVITETDLLVLEDA